MPCMLNLLLIFKNKRVDNAPLPCGSHNILLMSVKVPSVLLITHQITWYRDHLLAFDSGGHCSVLLMLSKLHNRFFILFYGTCIYSFIHLVSLAMTVITISFPIIGVLNLIEPNIHSTISLEGNLLTNFRKLPPSY